MALMQFSLMSGYLIIIVKMSTLFFPAKHSVLGGGPLAPRLDRRGGIGGIDGGALGVVAAASPVVLGRYLVML